MPTYEVQLQSGTYRVEARDDAHLAEITKKLSSDGGVDDYDAGKDMMRQGGLTLRNAATGIAGIPNMLGDAVAASMNLPWSVPSVAKKVLGINAPDVAMPSEAMQTGLTAIGLPEPTGTAERLAAVGSSALAGAGGANAVSKMASTAPGAVKMVSDFFAASPKMQALGAIGGALGVDQARSMGIENPLALMAVGSVAGALPGSTASLGQRLGSGARQAAAPFTARGKEIIVGEALNKVSRTPAATAERLAAAQEIVPGSRPMVSDVSQDPGMINAESALRGFDGRGVIAGRRSEQNAARVAELNRIARDERTLRQAQAKRDGTYDALAEPAFENANTINIGREWINNPVLRTIREIRESPQGARQTVREALDEVESMLAQDGVDLTNARVLYEIRKDLDLLRTGKLSGAGKSGRERANMRTAGSQISDVIRSLDDVIESGAPGYRNYMQMFAKRSIPVSQLQALQSLRERAVLAAPDPITGDDILSQAKFSNLLKNNLSDNPVYGGRGAGAANLRGTALDENAKATPVLGRLSRNQLERVDRIAKDLDRGSAVSAGTMRVPGSDSFKNLSVAAVIGRVLGDKTGEVVANSSLGKTIARPFSFLYRMPDEDIQMLMLEAWLDPALSARLMRQAQRAEIEGVARELARRAAAQSTAAAVYGQQRP